ncbi:MaoC/PaaZ C-terminal domain-containing protein [Haliangium sp.]|uniref:MaoC/PaaZ C-terminal domain-containing protein n=1 Tax=Haliangium sp. TaxID=2663208 RepID=UPI003D0F3A03
MSPLDLEQVGTAGRAFEYRYTWKDCALYALGVGARLPDELAFLYEQRGPAVLPTFAVLASFESLVDALNRVRADFARVVHGEQAVTLHRPIPPRGNLITTATLSGVYDKGKGALIVVESETKDADGQPIFDNRSSIFVVGSGGFGGPRGPAATVVEPPDRAPDFEVSQATSPEQAALYRLSGDLNPLHIDPAVARTLGFERPILHGLCTFGYAGRALVAHACDRNPTRLRALSGRFAGAVLPGDTLTTRAWQTEPGTYVLAVTKDDGTPVLTHAVAEIAAPSDT